MEGEEDEVEPISEMKLHVSPRVLIKLDTGIGLTSKATDTAPETGVMLSLPLF